MRLRAYERAGLLDLESRSEAIERAKKGKAEYEKRQAMIKKIDQVLKVAK